MLKKPVIVIALSVLLAVLPPCLCAEDVTMPVMSSNILGMMGVLSNLVFGLCYIVAAILGFMSIVFFRRYRQNSVETPLSKVFWTLALSAAIALLPFVAQKMGIYHEMEVASEQTATY